MWQWFSVLAGIILIFLVIRDILLTLMTPTGRGSISRWMMSVAWRTMRPIIRRWRSYRELAGPLTFIGVIGVWTGMIVVGWGLIYWPFLPDSFLVDFGLELDRDRPGNLVMAMYFSIVVLATLGFGDIVPTGIWLRLLVPLEGLVGFGLITAGISWFLSIFPALARRRRLAHQIALVREAGDTVDEYWSPETMATVLDSFSTQLIDVRSDQIQFPVIYYFRDADPAGELVPNLRYLLEMAVWAEDEYGEVGSPLFLHQHMLRRAIDDYLQAIVTQFLDLDTDDTDRMLDILAEDRM